MIEFSKRVSEDLLDLVCQKYLGQGSGRYVATYAPETNLVIKIEENGNQNLCEWLVWCEAQYTNKEVSKWLAPCIRISKDGKCLLQRRTEPIPKSEYPAKVPAFFKDLKYGNFGIIVENGHRRFVCHDYGNFTLTRGLKTNLVKAEWWES